MAAFLGGYGERSRLARDPGFPDALRFYDAFFALKDLQREAATSGRVAPGSDAWARLSENA